MNITGRDSVIMAKALFIAIRHLKKQTDPELSDIADMEAIMREGFPGHAESLAFLEDVKTAQRLGILNGRRGSLDASDLRALIKAERDRDNVVDF